MKKTLVRIRLIILVFLTHQVALPLLKFLRRPNAFTPNKEELSLFPQGSLGRDLYNFLEQRKLPLLKHYARHDLKHVLLEYDTTDEGEACLQSFMLGNGRISFPVLATVFYSLITMPEHWSGMKAAFIRGKRSAAFHGWAWNEILTESTCELREKIFNHA
jgi:hypothetical protein